MTKSKHILVHLHLYYINQLDEILARLQNLQELKFDLYVTMIENHPPPNKKLNNLSLTLIFYSLKTRGMTSGHLWKFYTRLI